MSNNGSVFQQVALEHETLYVVSLRHRPGYMLPIIAGMGGHCKHQWRSHFTCALMSNNLRQGPLADRILAPGKKTRIDMALFRWRDNLSVGVPAVDRDHKHLISLLNRLHFVDLAGDDHNTMACVLTELISYTKYHFRREETFMRLAEYPDVEAHAKLHRELTARLEQYEASFRRGTGDFNPSGFYDFLSDWLLVHIMTDDAKLTPYLENLAAAQAA